MLLALAAFLATAAVVFAGEKAPSKAVTLTGEVIDLYCYMEHPKSATGLDHMKCAKSCIKKGLPIGFLSKGVVYTIIGSEHQSAANMVVDYAGRQSTIKGKLIEHNGVKAVELVSIKGAK